MYLKRGAMRLARQFAKQILDEGLPLAGSGNIAYPFGVSAHIKRKKRATQNTSLFFGRGDGTWTHDLLVPNQARYQTALHLDTRNILYYTTLFYFLQLFYCVLKFIYNTFLFDI